AQPCVFEPPLDRSQPRHGVQQVMGAQLTLKGPRAGQPYRTVFQAAPHPQHDSAGPGSISVRRRGRAARAALKARPAPSLKALLPFVQPGAASRDLFANLAGAVALELQSNRFAAIGQFVFARGVHTPSWKGSMDSRPVRDVVDLRSPKLFAMLWTFF